MKKTLKKLMKMYRNKLLKSFLAAVFFVATPAVWAQQTLWQAAIPNVSEAGYYKVMISPEIAARAATDGHDLRIRDRDGKEIPYLLRTDSLPSRSAFHAFEIVSSGKDEKGNTRLLLRNPGSRPLSEIAVLLRNTTASRMVAVSGSNDGQSFYSLVDSVGLYPSNTLEKGDSSLVFLSLPQTTYPFLQLRIFDRDLLPLPVLAVGFLKDSSQRPSYTPVPSPAFSQRDSSDHKTYIRLRFAAPFRTDRLTLYFKEMPFYRREVRFYDSSGNLIGESIAESGAPLILSTQLHAATALLQIENEDSPPLTLLSVEAAQQSRYLLAHLWPGVAYTLHCGDATLPAPRYDLRYLGDRLELRDLPLLLPEAPKAVPASQKAPPVQKPLIGPAAMWAIIIAVGIGLVAATVGMMRRIGEKE